MSTEPKTVPRPMRLREDLVAQFEERFPWRGSLPQFVNRCLEEFLTKWGDSPTPDQVTNEAVDRVFRRDY